MVVRINVWLWPVAGDSLSQKGSLEIVYASSTDSGSACALFKPQKRMMDCNFLYNVATCWYIHTAHRERMHRRSPEGEVEILTAQLNRAKTLFSDFLNLVNFRLHIPDHYPQKVPPL